MSDDEKKIILQGKGQAARLGKQHELAGGPLGIFGEEAQQHDKSILNVSKLVLSSLIKIFPSLQFRLRNTLPKKEIHASLQRINPSLGQVLFIGNASIRPDGGIIEVLDQKDNWRVLLIGESKHQGNDVEKIRAGLKQGKNKDADFMVAGNAIERVHKNILEVRNFMLNETHFPYIVFLQGSNFATETFWVNSPDGRRVKVVHNAGSLNRIDRVTASNYGMAINKNYCRNVTVKVKNGEQMLQIPSLYFQCDPWKATDMLRFMTEITNTSLNVLSDDIRPTQ